MPHDGGDATVGGEWIASGWVLGECLGCGAFASVRAASNRTTGERAAVKVLSKSENCPDVMAAELDIMKHVTQHVPGHEHLVSLIANYEDASNVYLVMERCHGPLLSEVVAFEGCLSEAMAAVVMRQLVDAVMTLHAMGVVHRDIKTENVMWKGLSTRSHVKLFDYGLGRREGAPDAAQPRELLGTINYIAPEVFLSRQYTYACDTWALGVVLYEMLCGDVPFANETQIKMAPPDFREAVWASVSPSAKELIMRLLDKSPGKRPTAAQVLEHPWMTAARKAEQEQARPAHETAGRKVAEGAGGPEAATMQAVVVRAGDEGCRWAELEERQLRVLHQLSRLEQSLMQPSQSRWPPHQHVG
eukprot:jgi/Tetstr1/440326/TSEL_028663.t1